MSIGTRIAEQRKKNNFSQEYIAGKLDVSRQAVSKWEQDLSNPDTGNRE
jgi:transcriptional regulator with XRE-family HTH domain